ncbi:NTP/NDP exchange transporter [Sandaracinus amylolyticus]|uniref:NTP/NDP exchange transporter n=1 Tax=Sandaracinus amylolyticus TaxID=927083 RepID=UPI001F4482BD|nr:translocase [Sandaracinus amylolyticus]UJR83048.1 Hypothetical protein I5071_51140 [Sandaracinus amylolyticus]
MADPTPAPRRRHRIVDLHPGEWPIAILLAVDLFVVLVAYYVLKTAREPLVLATGGAEMKSYAAAVQALVLVPLVPMYGRLVARVRRERFVPAVIAVFIACIGLFAIAAGLRTPGIGIAFYVWVGIFSLAVVAQFWSVANDVLTEEQGKRIFPVVASGATIGAASGARIASWLFDAGLGVIALFGVAAALLALHLVCTVVAMRLHSPTPHAEHHEETNGFLLVWKSPYLRAIALMMLIANLVNTVGEYVLGRTAVESAEAALALAEGIGDPRAFVEARVGAFYGEFFFQVNVVAIALQLLVASSLVRFLGTRGAIAALPIVALGSYAMIAAGATLAIVRAAKVAENATDYSIMNTGRALLWLPTTPIEKYSAKQAIDAFFVRAGDVLAAAVVFVGAEVIELGVEGFAALNVVLCVAWLVLVASLAKKHDALSRAR